MSSNRTSWLKKVVISFPNIDSIEIESERPFVKDVISHRLYLLVVATGKELFHALSLNFPI